MKFENMVSPLGIGIFLKQLYKDSHTSLKIIPEFQMGKWIARGGKALHIR